MKKFTLLLLSVFLYSLGIAQTTYSWRNDQNPTSGQWNVSNYWWNGSSAALPGGGEILYLDGNVGTTMTNDLPSTNRFTILFGNGGSARTINGNVENTFYDYSKKNPKIENQSSNNQTIAFPLKWGYGVVELNPVLGDLTILSTINNNGDWTDVYSGNNNTLSINSMSGSGGLTIKSIATVKFIGKSTYTGDTYVDFGTLELQNDVASGTITVASGATLRINGTDVDINNLTISSGGSVIVVAGKSVTVNGSLTNNGALTLMSTSTDGTATIVTKGNVSGSGTTTVQQYLSGGRNWYLSSPVASADGSVITGTSGNVLYSYRESDNTWPAASSFSVGTGYVANVASANGGVYPFTGGALNTGDKAISLSRSATNTIKPGFNLVGNPYPSYLNIDNLKTNSDIEPTVWYRSYNSGYVFDTYNIPSGMSTGLSGLSVTGNIPPMQAFWLRVASGKTSATVNLLNANRCHQDVSTNKFRAPALNASARKVLRLQLSNGTAADEAVIYTDANASNGYDVYDSPKMSNGGTVPDIYSLAGSEQVAINGLNAVTTDEVVPLGFTTSATGSFTIKASEVSNFDADTKIILKDNILTTEQDLTDGSAYSFTSDPATASTRFSILFKSSAISTGAGNTADNQTVTVYKNADGKLAVNRSNSDSEGTVTVYSATGQKLVVTPTTGAITVLTQTFSPGVYVVTVSAGGKLTTKKVVVDGK